MSKIKDDMHAELFREMTNTAEAIEAIADKLFFMTGNPLIRKTHLDWAKTIHINGMVLLDSRFQSHHKKEVHRLLMKQGDCEQLERGYENG